MFTSLLTIKTCKGFKKKTSGYFLSTIEGREFSRYFLLNPAFNLYNVNNQTNLTKQAVRGHSTRVKSGRHQLSCGRPPNQTTWRYH